MSLEATTNAIEDYLIDSISFKLQPGASYVTDRRSVTFHPSGSNIYKPVQGTKVIKITLTGDQWLDPSTVQLQFDLNNAKSGTNQDLYLLGGPHVFFRRMRLLCGGTIVEDIDQYNRIHEMFHILTNRHNRDLDDVTGFEMRWDEEVFYNSSINNNVDLSPVLWKAQHKGYIPPGLKKTVCFKLLSGLLNQPKWIPLRYAPITLELELVNAFTDVTVEHHSINNQAGVAEPIWSDTNSSNEWFIDNVQLKCDLCTLDSALDNSYAEHMLSGKSLTINYNTYISQIQAVNGTDISVNVSRSVTRLKSIL